MALHDILSDSSNVSAVIELITLFFIVAGFFRWYDSKYQRAISEAKDQVLEHVDDTKITLGERLSRIDQALMRLEDRFHRHISENHHNHHNNNNSSNNNQK